MNQDCEINIIGNPIHSILNPNQFTFFFLKDEIYKTNQCVGKVSTKNSNHSFFLNSYTRKNLFLFAVKCLFFNLNVNIRVLPFL